MKIIATSDELKDLRNLFIQGFTSLDDKDRNELEDKIKDLENTINSFMLSIEKYQKLLDEERKTNKELMYQLNQSQAFITRLEKSNNSYENELKEVIDKLNKKQVAETILEDRIKQLFSSDNAHKSEKQKLQSTNRELEQTSKNKDKIISELETKLQELESDPRLSTGFDDFIEGFKEDVTCDLKKELEILKAYSTSLLTDKEEFKKNVDYWKESFEEAHEKNKNLRAEIEKLERIILIIGKMKIAQSKKILKFIKML